jgi:hypothetical protein
MTKNKIIITEVNRKYINECFCYLLISPMKERHVKHFYILKLALL